MVWTIQSKHIVYVLANTFDIVLESWLLFILSKTITREKKNATIELTREKPRVENYV